MQLGLTQRTTLNHYAGHIARDGEFDPVPLTRTADERDRYSVSHIRPVFSLNGVDGSDCSLMFDVHGLVRLKGCTIYVAQTT